MDSLDTPNLCCCYNPNRYHTDWCHCKPFYELFLMPEQDCLCRSRRVCDMSRRSPPANLGAKPDSPPTPPEERLAQAGAASSRCKIGLPRYRALLDFIELSPIIPQPLSTATPSVVVLRTVARQVGVTHQNLANGHLFSYSQSSAHKNRGNFLKFYSLGGIFLHDIIFQPFVVRDPGSLRSMLSLISSDKANMFFRPAPNHAKYL